MPSETPPPNLKMQKVHEIRARRLELLTRISEREYKRSKKMQPAYRQKVAGLVGNPPLPVAGPLNLEKP